MTTNPTPQRVAVVTGGSRGIGQASAETLARRGLAVVVGYQGNADLAEKVVRGITDVGGQAVSARADVADEAEVAAFFDTAEQTFGGIDVVVNAAGLLRLGRLVDLDLADFDAVHRTNVRGTFVVGQQAARRLRAGGALVTFSTTVVGTSLPTYGAYAASKGAVEALTLILARELRGRDVTVNAIAPGATATDLFFEGKTDADVARMAAAVPLERLGTPTDIAEAVAFVTSPEGHWVNGQVVRVNGGLA